MSSSEYVQDGRQRWTDLSYHLDSLHRLPGAYTLDSRFEAAMQGPELESIIRQNIEGVQTLIVSDVSGGCGQVSEPQQPASA